MPPATRLAQTGAYSMVHTWGRGSVHWVPAAVAEGAGAPDAAQAARNIRASEAQAIRIVNSNYSCIEYGVKPSFSIFREISHLFAP